MPGKTAPRKVSLTSVDLIHATSCGWHCAGDLLELGPIHLNQEPQPFQSPLAHPNVSIQDRVPGFFLSSLLARYLANRYADRRNLPRKYVRQRTEFFINVTCGSHRSRVRSERNGPRKLTAQFSSRRLFQNVPGQYRYGRPPAPLSPRCLAGQTCSEIQIWTLNASVRYFDYDFGSIKHERFRVKRT
jgi:hypothetical protein